MTRLLSLVLQHLGHNLLLLDQESPDNLFPDSLVAQHTCNDKSKKADNGSDEELAEVNFALN